MSNRHFYSENKKKNIFLKMLQNFKQRMVTIAYSFWIIFQLKTIK